MRSALPSSSAHKPADRELTFLHMREINLGRMNGDGTEAGRGCAQGHVCTVAWMADGGWPRRHSKNVHVQGFQRGFRLHDPRRADRRAAEPPSGMVQRVE